MNLRKDKFRLKICLRIGTNISIQSLIMNPGMSSTPTDLDGFRRLMALLTSESETDPEDRNSEDDKRVGKKIIIIIISITILISRSNSFCEATLHHSSEESLHHVISFHLVLVSS
jgi:hypothetical protein